MAQGKGKTITPQDSVRALIIKRRDLLGLSRDQLAFLAGYEQSTVRKIENGTRNPSLTAIFNLFGVLGLRPSTVMKRIEKDAGFELLPRIRIQQILEAEKPRRRPKKYRDR
jgi:transcriptional regulator with XRE-family HTH domain